MKHTQRGLTLIEILGALAIGSMLLLGLTAMIDSSMSELKGQQAALHQAQVVTAANKYLAAKYEDLVTQTAGGAVAEITVDDLKGEQLLSAGFSPENVYLQNVCVLVRQRPSTPPSEPKKLDALVVTYGGQPIPEGDIAVAAMHAGQGGGHLTYANVPVARGASWEMSTSDFRSGRCDGAVVLDGTRAHDSGHLASNLFYDGPGQLGTDFLYRNKVDGRPELNKMNTAILMGDKAVVDAGDDCMIDGAAQYALALDKDTRSALSCGADGKWRAASEWALAVNTYSDLPTSGNRRGDVRMVKNLSRAFTYDGATWIALAVDQNGDMRIPGQLSAGSIYVGNDTPPPNVSVGSINASGGIHADDHITTDRNITAAWNVTGNTVNATTVNSNTVITDNLSAQYATVQNNLTVNKGNVEVVEGNINALKGVVTTLGMWADQWAYASAYAVGSFMNPAGPCHIPGPLDQNGNRTYIYPIGTLVVDQNGLAMSCANDRTFRYPNGTYFPNGVGP